MRKGISINTIRKTRLVYVILSFILLFFVFNTLLFSVFYYFQKNTNDIQSGELAFQQTSELEIETQIIGKELDFIISDLNFIANEFQADMLEDDDYLETTKQIWADFSASRKIYDQMRYIDTNGDEIIRVDYTSQGVFVYDDWILQNKADRYYFTDSIDLESGQVFISRMDLNVEYGSIEIPIKPMIRFATPVFDENGETQGIIVLNYKAKELLKEFKQLPRTKQKKLFLLNSNGYWLSGENPDQEWTFMYDDTLDISFKHSFPEEWQQMTEDSGLFVTENGMFAYSKIFLDEKLSINEDLCVDNNLVLDEGSWVAVSYHPADGPNGDLIAASQLDLIIQVLVKNGYYFIILTILSLIVSILMYINKISQDKVRFYSTYDPLTTAFNRRAGLERVYGLMPKDSRRKTNICFAFLDVNGLKDVNDTLGHDAGDALIVTVAEGIKKNIRDEDFLIRMGGDEFMIILRHVRVNEAEDIWTRIKESFEKINQEGNRPYIISVSHGMVAVDEWTGKDVDELIRIADEQMYAEKREIKRGLKIIR